MKKLFAAIVLIIALCPVALSASECGNGVIEEGEMCEGAQICGQGKAGGCEVATYICQTGFVMLSGRDNACICFRPTCGDGCITERIGEECDPRATKASLKFKSIGVVENDGCAEGDVCTEYCKCIESPAPDAGKRKIKIIR
jgi:hypothetical protein